MLEPAALHEAELQKLFATAFLDEHYKFYFTGGWTDKYKAAEGTLNIHEFASVKNDCVIGYLAYQIDRRANSTDGLCAINFKKKSVTFSKDFLRFLKDIFEKYRFRKLSFGVFIGNPAEKMYDRYIRKFGGRIVGISRENSMLEDGKFYDYKMYEIFRSDYLRTVSH